MAHQKGIRVVPLVGPSSILLAMMASGMNGQNFAFSGYLPIEKGDRVKALKRMEKLSRDTGQSQIFMETPYRNHKLLDTVLESCNENTRLCIARDITLPSEFIQTHPLSYWKRNIPDLEKKPSIFIISAQ